MNTTAVKKIAGFMVVAAVFTLSVSAQSRSDVISAFNAGAVLSKTDIPAAIDSFELAIALAEQIGEPAEDLRVKVIQYLPGLYYQVAYNTFSGGSNMNEAIASIKETLEVAQRYENTNVIENSNRLLIQAYATMASTYFSNKAYGDAVAAFDSVLMIDAGNRTALSNKALIYRTMGDLENFEISIDEYISQLEAANDTALLAQARGTALDYYRIEAGRANQSGDLERAMTLLNTAEKYGPHKELYYIAANVQNKQGNFSEAATNARAGLELETGSEEDKAKFYFELAEAQAKMGDTENACQNYANASFGAFVEASQAQQKNLKCQ